MREGKVKRLEIVMMRIVVGYLIIFLAACGYCIVIRSFDPFPYLLILSLFLLPSTILFLVCEHLFSQRIFKHFAFWVPNGLFLALWLVGLLFFEGHEGEDELYLYSFIIFGIMSLIAYCVLLYTKQSSF